MRILRRVLKTKSLVNKRFLFVFSLLLLAGFLLRVYFAPQFIKESGDIRLFADWGEKYWEYGSKDFYYINDWYYAAPNYPPIITLIYAGAYWLFDHKYVLPQLHNLVKIPPAAFIVYFYDHGYHLLLKLPGILADLGLTVLIYLLVLKLSKNKVKSFLASSFYLLNPVTIFLSSVWGQMDSLVALFGLLSFLALLNKKIWLSIPLIFTSFYLKPNWGVFIPLYIFLLIGQKVKLKQIFIGIGLSLIIFFVSTRPFAQDNVVSFASWLLKERILPTAVVTQKASVSAFNLHTLLFEIDKTSDVESILGIPANIFGLIIFSIVNLFSFSFLKRQKYSLYSLMVSLFAIGFSSYLFLTNMLERYFFSSLIPLIVVAFFEPKILLYALLINLITFSNLVHAFFRRTSGEVATFFSQNGFLVIRMLSLASLSGWVLILRKFNYFKLNIKK